MKALVLAPWLLGGALQVSLPLEANPTFDEALLRLRAGDYVQGCKAAARVIEQDPQHWGAFNLLGICAVQRGNHAEAEDNFRKSLELSPGFVEARVNLGLSQFQLGKSDAALAQLEQAVGTKPDHAMALYQLGRIQMATGAVTSATKHLRRAHQLEPGSVPIRLALAGAQLAGGQSDQAIQLVEPILRGPRLTDVSLKAALIALEADRPDLVHEVLSDIVRRDAAATSQVLDLARSLSQQENYEMVLPLLQAIQEEGDNSAEWNALIGYAEYKLAQLEAASTHLRRAIELAPEVEEYYLKIGEMLLHYNSDKVAIKFFQLGLRNLPESPRLHYSLAVSYWAHNLNLDKAIENLNKSLSLAPEFSSALELLCRCYYREKNWPRLEATAERLIEVNQNVAGGYYYLAVALSAGDSPGDDRQAVLTRVHELLQKAIAADSSFADAHVELGKLLVERNAISEAISEFEAAIEADPESSQAYYQLALAYRRTGEVEKSLQLLEKFRKLSPRERFGKGWEVLFHLQDE
jgi:tetratricopeptide (TPR) repeat protein